MFSHIFLQIAPLPTPFPTPGPLPEELAAEATKMSDTFWSYEFLGPIFSAMQTVLIWANKYNILTYAIILMVIISVYFWLLNFVGKRGEDL